MGRPQDTRTIDHSDSLFLPDCSFSRSLDLTWFSSEVEKINGTNIVDYYDGKHIVQWIFRRGQLNDVHFEVQLNVPNFEVQRSSKIFLISHLIFFSVIFCSGHEWFAACSEIAASSLHGLEAYEISGHLRHFFGEAYGTMRQWQFWWGLGSHQTLETVALAGVGLGGIEPEIALEMLKLKISIWEDMYRLV